METGVPIPDQGRPSHGRARWPKIDYDFWRMEVGDSFRVYPYDGQPLIVCQNAVTFAASQYCKAFLPGARKFTSRQVDNRFVRVWRIV